MAWYKIVLQHFPVRLVYHGISHLSLVFSCYIHSPHGSCVYRENTNDSCDIFLWIFHGIPLKSITYLVLICASFLALFQEETRKASAPSFCHHNFAFLTQTSVLSTGTVLETESAVPMAVIVFVCLHQWVRGLQQAQYSCRLQQVRIFQDSNRLFFRIFQGKHKGQQVLQTNCFPRNKRERFLLQADNK